MTLLITIHLLLAIRALTKGSSLYGEEYLAAEKTGENSTGSSRVRMRAQADVDQIAVKPAK